MDNSDDALISGEGVFCCEGMGNWAYDGKIL